MQSSIKDELATFHQSMELIMEILQSPQSSTPLTRRATMKKTGQDQLSTIHEATRETEIKITSAISSREDASLISKIKRKKNFFDFAHKSFKLKIKLNFTLEEIQTFPSTKLKASDCHHWSYPSFLERYWNGQPLTMPFMLLLVLILI